MTAQRAERIALAILSGDVSTADAMEDLRLANRERAVELDVQALADYRAGLPVWAFPTTAPYAGF